MTRIGSLFSGYGGLDRAVQIVFGGELAWVSDIDPGACKILAHHHPDVPNLGDITAIDWDAVEPVDILTGGFPCQDVSAAGKRTGLIRYGDKNRSGLWAEMARAIDKLRPALVVAENVRGLLSAKADAHPDVFDCLACLADTNDKPMRALGAVLGDLAALGYDAAWHGMRASDVGAPHQRFRVFVMAWPADSPITERRGQESKHLGASAGRTAEPRERPGASAFGGRDDCVTLLKTPTSQLAINGGSQHPDKRKAGGHSPTLTDEIEHLLPTPQVADAMGGHLNRSGARSHELLLPGAAKTISLTDWGVFAPAVSRWESLTRDAPAPTGAGIRGGQSLSPAFVEWMMGLPAGHVTAPEIGLTRNEQLKALGNGVVPQQAQAALRYLLAAVATS